MPAFSLFALVLLGCASQPQPAAQQPNSNQPKEDKMEIKITSAAFNEGQLIPRQYTCDGMNLSPPLEWSGVPKDAKTLAIICDDPDAPSGTWVHWVIFDLPARTNGLPEAVPARVPEAATESLPLWQALLSAFLGGFGFAGSRAQSRQLVRHGHFHVNGRRVNIPSYQVKPDDIVTMTPGSSAAAPSTTASW